MTYLLDTNVFVQYLRGRNPSVLAATAEHANAGRAAVLCGQSGAFSRALRSARPEENRAKVDAFVRPYQSLPFDDEAAEIQAQIRHELETAGTPIGPYDLQIAAIALAHDQTLVTHNTAEFGRVRQLSIEDWETP